MLAAHGLRRFRKRAQADHRGLGALGLEPLGQAHSVLGPGFRDGRRSKSIELQLLLLLLL
jgi:hypothetical protein